jgi:hypothetical protein
MNQNSNPLDHLIELCEQAADYGTITKFTILNAKDELRKLRQQVDESNQFKNIAWATINGRGDMFDLTTIYNRFCNDDATISLYCNKEEFKEKCSKLYDK